jgi:hypothetical protein
MTITSFILPEISGFFQNEPTASFLLSIINKIQRYTIFLITVSALHASGCFSSEHQGLTNSTHSIGYVPNLLATIARVGELEMLTVIKNIV